MWKHLKMHRGIKPDRLQCHICEKTLCTNNALKVHIETIHDGKLHPFDESESRDFESVRHVFPYYLFLHNCQCHCTDKKCLVKPKIYNFVILFIRLEKNDINMPFLLHIYGPEN